MPAARGLIGRGEAKLNAGRSTKSEAIQAAILRRFVARSPTMRGKLTRPGQLLALAADMGVVQFELLEGGASMLRPGPRERDNPPGQTQAYPRRNARAPSRAGSGRGSHRQRCRAGRSAAAAGDHAR